MKSIIVTGGDGMLGNALKAILPSAIFLTRTDCDLRDLYSVRKVFSELQPTSIIHLAAVVGGIKKNAEKNADLLTQNLQINTNVLSVAAELKCPRVLSLLSSCAYQTYPDKPSSEADLHINLPYHGNLGYGMSKRILDIQIALLSEQYGHTYSSLTPVTMYGPFDNFSLEDGHVVSSLIRKTVEAKDSHTPLYVWGSGEAVRQFIFVKDVAIIVLKVLNDYKNPQTKIIAPNSGISIRNLVEVITGAVGFNGPVIYDISKPEGQKFKTLESKFCPEYLKGFLFTSLEQGIKETVGWFINNQRKLNLHS